MAGSVALDSQLSDSLRIAVCHDWLTNLSGSDQVAREIVRALGARDVFTFAADPALARSLFPDQRVQVHRLGLTPLARRKWRWMLPLMPHAWRALDLSDFDLVVTSSHAFVNSIRPPLGTPIVSYCHTPMRYAWDWQLERGRFGQPLRAQWPRIARTLSRIDAQNAQRVTLFLANSHHVRQRIRRYYGRDSVVVYPPIDTEFWTPSLETDEREDFFLLAGRLVAYKRVDVVIEAAARAGAPLVVASSDPELQQLRTVVGPKVRLVQRPSREQLRVLYRRARALVFAGVEDFGMMMVEAQACGTPVIAFAEGGACETVLDGETGSLYSDPSPHALARILASFDPGGFSRKRLRRQALRFGKERFDQEFRQAIATVVGRGAST